MKISKMTQITIIFLLALVILDVAVRFSGKNLSESIAVSKSISENTLIKVYKKDRLVELHVNDQLINKFKMGLGSQPTGDKNKEGDMRTPVGKYYICTRNDKSKYTLFLGVSYPNIEDGKRGLDSGLIDKKTFEEIKAANEKKIQPSWNTPLGGEIGIHGGGNSKDWTWGCMALSDQDIKILWKYAKLRTPVEIYE
ncbi:L,D-transpeptidase family protein [Oceanirhabdus seepicola]|nr:L,D-transpeptidase family protein [Oceanirhabdus seepicola]